MTKQVKLPDSTSFENDLLDLEKKYFDIILEIMQSDDFIEDLELIEKSISDNYTKFENIWELKNKIKIPAERVVRHHLYLQMNNLIEGIYPSPLSSDFGIKTDDAVICIDIKTIDTVGNPNDIKATTVEKNQTSFDNKNYKDIKIIHNMNPMDDYSGRPVLTYVVKIIYSDNDVTFKLNRDKELPSMVLACIPNGKLSRFFNYDIVENCKTYDYYDSEKDGNEYKPIELTASEYDNPYVIEQKCAARHLIKMDFDWKKNVYLDPKTSTLYFRTTQKKKKGMFPVKSGGTVRFGNAYLEDRYDSRGNYWKGYIEWTLRENTSLQSQMSKKKPKQ